MATPEPADEPSGDLQYAVHVDGGLVTARSVTEWDEGRYGAEARRLVAPCREALGPMPEAIFRNPDAAARMAEAIKRAAPEDLVTIVVWFED